MNSKPKHKEYMRVWRHQRWLEAFAHGIYVMELRWTCLLARSATHRIGVSDKRIRRHVEGAA